jgi:hypothetical protein
MKAGILAVALAMLAAPAGAQTESKCTAAKHQAAGDYARALEACRAKALKKGDALDPECDAKALEKLAKQFEKAEKKLDCVATSEGGIVAEVADQLMADLAATLQRGTGICCELEGACGWVTDPAHCAAIEGGVPGAQGTVCDGSGNCVAEPTFGGPCCQSADVGGLRCSLFLAASDACVTDPAEAFVEPAICTTSRCIRFEGTPPAR